MWEFSPNEQKEARFTLENPKAMDLLCEVELYLGLGKVATSGVSTVNIPAGQTVEVPLPITMPAETGAYGVFVAVWYEGNIIGLFEAAPVEIAQPPALNMEITNLTAMSDDAGLGSGYWLVRADIRITNTLSEHVTRNIKCVGTFGEYNPEHPDTQWYERYIGQGPWGHGTATWHEVSLSPGQSVDLVSDRYYLGRWHSHLQRYEWANWPLGTYRSGVRKKYWFRMIDEYGNKGPVDSIGTAITPGDHWIDV